MKVEIPGFDLPLTANSGQCFRFSEEEHGAYSLVAGGQHLMITPLGADLYEFSCSEAAFSNFWHSYFDLDTNYQEICQLVKADGSYLHRAVCHASGLRILRQEAFETLICFILSQRKSIPAIKRCVDLLCSRFGRELKEGVYAFPDPASLALATEEGLKTCGLGYRARYVRDSAAMVASGAVDLKALYALSDSDLLTTLQSFPGVGVKVASCVMLFAYHRMDAFPVDVWIDRVLKEEFPAGFPFSDYPGAAGILQQHLFCYARHQAGKR